MGEALKALLHSFIWIVLVGLMAAAIIKLNVSLQLRLLLFVSAVALYSIYLDLFRAIAKVHETQVKVVYWLRNTYIATEMNRLEPENRKPAHEILADDLEQEKRYRDAYDSLERDSLFSLWGILFGGTWVTLVLLHIIGPLIICGLVIYFWDGLVGLLP